MLGGRERLKQKHPEVRHEVLGHAVIGVVQKNLQILSVPFRRQQEGLRQDRQVVSRVAQGGVGPNILANGIVKPKAN